MRVSVQLAWLYFHLKRDANLDRSLETYDAEQQQNSVFTVQEKRREASVER